MSPLASRGLWLSNLLLALYGSLNESSNLLSLNGQHNNNIIPVISSVNAEDAKTDDDDDLDSEDDTPAEPEEAVVTLTDATWEEFIKKNEKVIIEFYAPWCGHCKSLAPEYEKAAQELKKRKRKTKLAKVDATVESKVAAAHSVQGYPTLVYYNGGEKSEYNGPRQADGIVSWVEKREKSALETCTEESVAKYLEEKSEHYVVVGRVKKKSGKLNALKKAAQKLFSADQTEKMVLCAIYLGKDADDKKDSSLTMYKFNTTTVLENEFETKFEGVWNTDRVSTFIQKSKYSTVGVFDMKLYSPQALGVVNSKQPLVYAYVGEKDEKVSELLLKYIKDQKPKDEFFKYAELNLKEKPTDGKNIFSIPDTQSPYLLSLKGEASGAQKFVFPLKDAKIGEIKAFVDSLKTGEAKAHYKSSAVPENEREDEVLVLVGSTWEKYVMDPKKDTFVEYYAPWCGHCKSLAPKWTELAKKIKSKGLADKIIIAKMDATENESPESVTGFPKLVFYPAVKSPMKKKTEYNGARESDAMYDFLVENAKNLEGVEVVSDGPKLDKKSFNMVERERARKAKKAGKKEEL